MGAIRDNHRRRLGEASGTAAPVLSQAPAVAGEHRLLLVRLGVDLRRLSDIQSLEAKIALKAELLPEYLPWVEGVVAGDGGAPDEIVTRIMIWLIDIGAYDQALPVAAYVIRHNLTLPERFNRTAPTLIAEEIADAALKRLGQEPNDDDPSVFGAMARTLDRVAALVADQDIFDEVRAKLEKARGLAAMRRAQAIAADADGPAGARRGGLTVALGHLRRALELHDGSGVKTAIGKLEKELRKEATDG